MTRAERTLESIIRQAETLRPKSEEDDSQMYYLIGGIIANAEDALGALRAGQRMAALDAFLPALASGSFTLNGHRLR
jgi:hypothetical protein